ncbi:MAG TPA: cytochrome c3 family protein, partial [Sunxiuqinia sp.]|nr:cytochrome c3 family protein [Sunxiuqinia sp.]
MKPNFPVLPASRYLLVAVFIVIFSILYSPLRAQSNNNDYSHGEDHGHSDIKRGERFFLGLLPHNIQYNSCVSCHNLRHLDTLNWNPSAMAIAEKYRDKDFAAFKNVVMNPSGGMMAKVHEGFQIEDSDLETVKTYLDSLAETGPRPEKPGINGVLIFLALGIIITWALLELLFFHKVKYRIVPALIFLLAFGYQGKMLLTEGILLGRSPGYAPDQPIKFSHKVHAGNNKIACMYCHHNADKSKSAGIPEMNLCMNCHILVREGSHSGKFEIAKVVDAVQNKNPVKWVRLHNLPDFVYFSHAIHVG